MVVAMATVMLFGNSLSVLAQNYSFMGLPEAPEKQQVQDGDYILGGGSVFRVYTDGVPDNNPQTTSQPITGDYYASRSGDGNSGYKLHLTSITPAVIPGDGGENTQEPKAAEHHHNFQWEVVKEPTLNEDGLAQSVCECGAVEAQQPISAATAFVKMVCDTIETAPEGAMVEVETDMHTCYTAKIMEKLSTRPDITFKTTFMTEEKTWKTFTIPAGQVPADDELFYGFTYLGNLYGWGDCDHVHDEACGGEDDCTHVHDKND